MLVYDRMLCLNDDVKSPSLFIFDLISENVRIQLNEDILEQNSIITIDESSGKTFVVCLYVCVYDNV